MRSNCSLFQSTLPLRGATRSFRDAMVTIRNFNPHSPCGERRAGAVGRARPYDFNPHSPCGERPPFSTICATESVFQSTLPLRGATAEFCPRCRTLWYFNPHSPCGERLLGIRAVVVLVRISIHTPLAGSDDTTTPAVAANTISIHTPLAGSDHVYIDNRLPVFLEIRYLQ